MQVTWGSCAGQRIWRCFTLTRATAWRRGKSLRRAPLLTISWLAFRLRRTRPYLVVGWCWYLGTLFPVIGLVQVGEQAMADRYMYVPMVGLLIALAWGAYDAVQWQAGARRAGAMGARRFAIGVRGRRLASDGVLAQQLDLVGACRGSHTAQSHCLQ